MNGTHNFELKDVPTTLNWEGGLFPTAKSPRVSNTPMTGTFRVKVVFHYRVINVVHVVFCHSCS